MVRDKDLIRNMLLDLEAVQLRRGGIMSFKPDDFTVNGFSADQVDYHFGLLLEAGLIDDGDHKPMGGRGFRALTWAGHDLLDSIRDPEVWKKTKKGAEEAGGFTIDLLRDLAKGLLRKQIEEYTGVKL